MKVLYVAGPYRSKEGVHGIVKNIEAAGELAIELWKLGFPTICPHKNTALFDGAAPDSVWLDGDLELLSRCDGLVTMPNYLESEGAKAEVRFAELTKIQVFNWPTDRDALLEWGSR